MNDADIFDAPACHRCGESPCRCEPNTTEANKSARHRAATAEMEAVYEAYLAKLGSEGSK